MDSRLKEELARMAAVGDKQIERRIYTYYSTNITYVSCKEFTERTDFNL